MYTIEYITINMKKVFGRKNGFFRWRADLCYCNLIMYCHVCFYQAEDSRDSLAMALYAVVFRWILKKINACIRGPESYRSISVLDIFGFENFQVQYKNHSSILTGVFSRGIVLG